MSMLSLTLDSGQNQNVMNSDERPISLEQIPKSIIWTFQTTLFGNDCLSAINWLEKTLYFMWGKKNSINGQDYLKYLQRKNWNNKFQFFGTQKSEFIFNQFGEL